MQLTASDGTLSTSTTGTYSPGNVIIQLYAGWNMVGYPSKIPRLASDTLPGSASRVAFYNSVAPYLIIDGAPGAVTFVEGNAYWVYVPANIPWSVVP